MNKKRYHSTVYQRIMKNYNNGKGMYLTPEDVNTLGRDSAIETIASDEDILQCEITQKHKRVKGDDRCDRCGDLVKND